MWFQRYPHRQTDALITILCNRSRGRSKKQKINKLQPSRAATEQEIIININTAVFLPDKLHGLCCSWFSGRLSSPNFVCLWVRHYNKCCHISALNPSSNKLTTELLLSLSTVCLGSPVFRPIPWWAASPKRKLLGRLERVFVGWVVFLITKLTAWNGTRSINSYQGE